MESPHARTDSGPDPEILSAYRRVVRGVSWVGGLPLAGAALAAALLYSSGVLLGAGLYAVLLLGPLFAVSRAIARREREARHPRADAKPRRSRRGALLALGLGSLVAALAAGALVAGPIADAVPAAAWLDALESVVAAGAGDLPSGLARLAGAAAVAVAIAAALLGPWLAGCSRRELPEGAALACWFRFLAWVSLAAGVELLLAGFGEPIAGLVVSRVLLAVALALGLEMALRGAWRLRDAHRPPARALTDSRALRLLASRGTPIGSLFAVLADVFGIDLRGAWALRFTQRALLPIAGAILLLYWLSTSLVVVAVGERAVLERFGRVASRGVLRPGLHVVLPWPVDRVRRLETDRVRSRTLGYAGEREGASRLWTVRHSEEEYNLLVGGGTELVTVNGILQYRVDDPHRFLYRYQNPEELLHTAADRVLLRFTHGRSLDGVLSENLAVLARAMEEEIRDAARRLDVGIQVVDFAIVGLHPPVDVAADYQRVVSAAIARDTSILTARAYRERELPRARGEGVRLRRGARAEMVERVAGAQGAASAFDSERDASGASPELYRFRRRLEVLESALRGRPFHVVDDRIERDGGVLWLLD